MFGALRRGAPRVQRALRQPGRARRRARWRAGAAARSAVRGCRTLGKRDLVLNDALPKIEVNPDTYEVRADGELLTMRAGGRAAAGAAVLSVLSSLEVSFRLKSDRIDGFEPSSTFRCVFMTVVERVYRETELPDGVAAYRARHGRRSAGRIATHAHGRRRSDGGVEFGTSLPRGTRAARRRLLRPRRRARIVVVVVERAGAGVRRSSRGRAPEWGLFAYHIGNRHQPLMITDRALVCPDVPGVEQLLQQHQHSVRARDAAVHAGRDRSPDISIDADSSCRRCAAGAAAPLRLAVPDRRRSRTPTGSRAATAQRRRRPTPAICATWMDVCLDEAFGRLGRAGGRGARGRRFATADWDALVALDESSRRCGPRRRARRASRAMGLRLLKTWQALHPDRALEHAAGARARAARSGRRCRSRLPARARLRGDRPARRASQAFAYTRLAATVSAAMRLMPIGQTRGARAAGRRARRACRRVVDGDRWRDGARAGIVRAGDRHRGDDAAVRALAVVPIVTASDDRRAASAIGGPVGSGKTALVDALCKRDARPLPARRDHQRHLHARGHGVPRPQRGAAGRSHHRRADRRLSAHGDPRGRVDELRRARRADARAIPISISSFSRAAATTSPRASAPSWWTRRSTSSTSRAATRFRARAAPA